MATQQRSVDHASVFSQVYRLDLWGGSGTGSSEASTRRYRLLLAHILQARNVKRVVDLGCGDWSFSQLIDWTGAQYLGLDVVQSIIRRNRRRYSRPNIRFGRLDLQRRTPPPADLYLVKDLLQHWTGPEIKSFLHRMAGRSMLITNSISRKAYSELPKTGDFRPLDVLRPPFCLPGEQVLRYRAGPWDFKNVVLIWPESQPPARQRQ